MATEREPERRRGGVRFAACGECVGVAIDVDSLTHPLSGDSPAGVDLSMSPEFLELKLAFRGHLPQERMINAPVKEEKVVPYSDLLDRAVALASRSRDLRIAGYVLWAGVGVHGYEGLADALTLIQRLIDGFWATGLLPLAEDPSDPWERTNVLIEFDARPGRRGEYPVQTFLRDVPLARTRQHGTASLTEVLVARGELPVDILPEATDAGRIEAALRAESPERWQSLADHLTRATDAASAIEKSVRDASGGSASVSLGELRSLLGSVRAIVDERLAAHGLGKASDSEPAGGTGGEVPPPRQGLSGEVSSRTDVVLALEKVLRYYESNEPGSPVPLFARAAQRLVTMSFVEIMTQLDRGIMEKVKEIGESA